MTAREAEPPRDDQPEQAFNFGALNDDQVVMLGRFIIAGIDREYDEGRGIIGPEDVAKVYVGGMALLLAQDPHRAKTILKRQALSSDVCDEEMAARCAGVVAPHDYELARDIVVHALGGEYHDDVLGIAGDIKRSLEPVQLADFERAMDAARSSNYRITPLGLVT